MNPIITNNDNGEITSVYKVHLTDKYKNEAADKLITKLKQDLAANEAYIQELEETYAESSLKNEIDLLKEQLLQEQEKNKKLKEEYTSLNQTYNKLLENPELKKEEYLNKIKELQAQVLKLTNVRDTLLSRYYTSNYSRT